MVKSIPNLSLGQSVGDLNVNTCGNPDCGNYGVAPDPRFVPGGLRQGRERRRDAFVADPGHARGVGRYKLSSASNLGWIGSAATSSIRTSARLEGRAARLLAATASAASRPRSCRTSTSEIERLASQNGLLDGPCCGACARPSTRPTQVFNGVNDRAAKGPKVGGLSVRLICRGQKGARSRRSTAASRIAAPDPPTANGTGINDLRRVLEGPRRGRPEDDLQSHFLARTDAARLRARSAIAWRDRLAVEGGSATPASPTTTSCA